MAVGRSRDMALRSRYVRGSTIVPSAGKDPGAFVAFLRSAVERYGVRLIIPLTDPDIIALELHRDEFEPDTTLAMASSPAIRRTMNKRVNLEIAREHDVPCPRQFELESPDQIPEMIKYLGFPIVLKNPGPTFDPSLPPPPFRVLYAHDEAELRRHVAEHHGRGAAPLYQECATGTVHNVCCFASGGEVKAIHEYHSIRRYLGQGVLRRTTEPTPELERYARAMMKAVKWDGPAHVGFFVSSDRSRIWYMETNGRFWGSVQGSVDAGWTFPIGRTATSWPATCPNLNRFELAVSPAGGAATSRRLHSTSAAVRYPRPARIPVSYALHFSTSPRCGPGFTRTCSVGEIPSRRSSITGDSCKMPGISPGVEPPAESISPTVP